jgi:hypothetical protein
LTTGCTGTESSGSLTTSSTGSTETVRTTRDCSSESSGSQGAAPPWYDPESPADIVITNNVDRELNVSLSIGDSRTSITLPEDEQWVSGNIIKNNESPEIIVRANNSQATYEWIGERNNRRFVWFVVEDDKITVSGREKSCPE